MTKKNDVTAPVAEAPAAELLYTEIPTKTELKKESQTLDVDGVKIEFVIVKGGNIGFRLAELPVPSLTDGISVDGVRISKFPDRGILGWANLTVRGLVIYNVKVVASKKVEGTYFMSIPHQFNATTKKWYDRVWMDEVTYKAAEKLVVDSVTAKAAELKTVATAAVSSPSDAEVLDDMALAMLAKEIETDLHNVQLANIREHTVHSFKGNVRAVDIKGFRFLTQNVNTGSHYAQLAQQGNKVMWITRAGKFYAKLINGEFTKVN